MARRAERGRQVRCSDGRRIASPLALLGLIRAGAAGGTLLAMALLGACAALSLTGFWVQCPPATA